MAFYPETLFDEIADHTKRAFLAAYAHTGRLVRAAKAAQCNWRMHYYWLKVDPHYAEKFAEAKQMAGDFLEDEAIRRATEGVTRTIFFKDTPIAEETDYSDTLLIFLLKGAKPEQYKDRFQVEHKGAVELLHKLRDLPGLSEDELTEVIAEAERYANGQ